MTKSRWANWSRGTEEKLGFGSFTEAMDTGNPTGTGTMSPAERARQLGLQSDGSGGYIDPASGEVVARTVNGELVFYDNRGATGGVVSDGAGGQQLANAQPSWSDPKTGMLTTPPAQPESPEEIAAVPDATPAVAPMGYTDFMKRKKEQAYAEPEPEEMEQPTEMGGGIPAMAGEIGMGGGMMGENYKPEDLRKRLENPGAPPRGYRRGHPQFRTYDAALDAFKAQQQAQQSQVAPEGPGDLISKVKSAMDHLQDIGGDLAADGDELGDELASAVDKGDFKTASRAVQALKSRDDAGAVPLEDAKDALYEVISSGGLGSDRGRYVEQGLTDHVLPQIFDGVEGMEFFNDGGPRVKTDVRSSQNGEEKDRYTVKSTVGTDGLEANNAGFRRFFEMWGLNPTEGPGKAVASLMGIPLDWAEDNGFGDGIGLWDDKRDGLWRDGKQATRQLPIQRMYPDVEFSPEELNANSMLPSRFKEMFPEEMESLMTWLNDNKMELARRIMLQRDNDFGEGGSADPNARPNVDFDPNPVNRAAWYHLDKASKGSPELKGRLDTHDISEEALAPILENAEWELGDGISSGFRLNAINPNAKGRRNQKISLLNLTRKANKAGGGRYGNGFHSPRFGYNHNAFDLYPLVSSTPVEMNMGAKVQQPKLNKAGKQVKNRAGEPQTVTVDGKIIPSSVKVGETQWGDGYNPMDSNQES